MIREKTRINTPKIPSQGRMLEIRRERINFFVLFIKSSFQYNL